MPEAVSRGASVVHEGPDGHHERCRVHQGAAALGGDRCGQRGAEDHEESGGGGVENVREHCGGHARLCGDLGLQGRPAGLVAAVGGLQSPPLHCDVPLEPLDGGSRERKGCSASLSAEGGKLEDTSLKRTSEGREGGGGGGAMSECV